jgi:hypothetical protein
LVQLYRDIEGSGENSSLRSESVLKRDAAEKSLSATDLITEQTWWEVYVNHQVSRYHKLSWLREQKQLSYAHHPHVTLYQRLKDIQSIVASSDHPAHHRDFAFLLLQLLRGLSEDELTSLIDIYQPYLIQLNATPNIRSYNEWVNQWPVEAEPEVSLFEWIKLLDLIT